MSLFKRVMGGVLGLFVIVFLGGFILPSTVHVERSLAIHARPTDIYPLVSDLTQWSSWSPWAKMDPNMVLTVAGTDVGQTMHWQSEDPMVGTGTQEITALTSPSEVKTHLDFGTQGQAEAAFKLTPQDDDTLVVWSLDTDLRAGVPLLMQPLSTYFRFVIDSAVGQDYETGLANLKTIIEQ
ncbi:SRPBCC family protein [Acaryochloris sp. IP29b_bin.148]|uniref:SRPBCC family protein n=1 Tax=Acaryochloris sp. IP29b_bin.148 TaxID=2969218 RepID=UPI00260F7BC6|nr:SRPBCC family protein [Acaryochloris sp. IP29b_bin.148]